MKNLLLLLSITMMGNILQAQHRTKPQHQDVNNVANQYNLFEDELFYYGPASTKAVVRIDSIIKLGEDGYYKILKAYNPDGTLQNVINQVNENGEWINYSMVSYAYDTYGNMTLMKIYDWTDETGWVITNQWTHSYDYFGNRLSVLAQVLMNGSLANAGMQAYTYDSSGNLISLLHQQWQNSAWINYSISLYTYNSLSKTETYTFKLWENNEWSDKSMVFYAYDPEGDLKSEMGFSYSMEAWHETYYYHYRWDSTGNKTYQLSQEWDPLENSWIDYRTDSINYNSNGNWVSWHQMFHYETWETTTLRTRDFDNDQNLIMILEQEWTGETWVNHAKAEYMFEQGKVSAKAYDWLAEQWVDSFLNESLDVIIGGNIVYDTRAKSLDLYYTDVTGIEDEPLSPENEIIHCLPNPATNQITIEINQEWRVDDFQIELYNQSGQRVRILKMSSNLATTTSLNVEHLPPGSYVMSITSGKESYTQKIILSGYSAN